MDGRTFWVRPVGSWVLESGSVVAQGLAASLDKPLEWAVGFFFGNTELNLELWNIIAGISGFDVIAFFQWIHRALRGSSPCVAPNVVPMKADRPLVEKTRVLNGSAVSAGMSGTLLLRSSNGFAVRCGGY